MTALVDDDRHARALELAVAAAKREAQVDRSLADLASDLNNLGERLRSNTAELHELANSQIVVRGLVDGVRDDLKTRDAVSLALIEAGKNRGDKTFTTVQIIGLSIGAIVTTSSLIVSILTAIGH